MKRREIIFFTFLVLAYFSIFIKNGNATFGDYQKRLYSSIKDSIYTKTTKANITDFQTHSTHRESKKKLNRKNSNVQERIYTKQTNYTDFHTHSTRQATKKNSSLEYFSAQKRIHTTLTNITDFQTHATHQELKKTSRHENFTIQNIRLYENNSTPIQPDLGTLQTNSTVSKTTKNSTEKENLNLEDLFEQKLPEISQEDGMSHSVYDLTMDFGRGQQIYPFESDISLPVFRRKREVNHRNNFSSHIPNQTILNYGLLRKTRELFYLRRHPSTFQLSEITKSTYKSMNFREMKEREAKALKKIEPTVRGTLDSTWREAIQQLNPIQRRIIQDLFSYGPSTTLPYNLSATIQTSPMILEEERSRKVGNHSLLFSKSLQFPNSSVYYTNSCIREFGKNLKSISKNTSKLLTSTLIPRTARVDENLMKEWLKSLNPQDQKEIENIFFNGSSPLYDIKDLESIKNAWKNEFPQGEKQPEGNFSTKNPKSTFILKNDKQKYTPQPGPGDFGNYNDEDLSKLLKQVPPDKLKIVNDWCDEISRDLHRRFPTATMKEGETRERGPFPPTSRERNRKNLEEEENWGNDINDDPGVMYTIQDNTQTVTYATLEPTNQERDHAHKGPMTRSRTRQLLSSDPRSEEARCNSGEILA